ncbi:hypothetical protein [Maribacter sp. 4G9]|uniref:hypothetical protein n=1 Tax=Maribacter sp. 4G9 TaxID=1889777 RepID=UPI000C14E63B|nr:hypothetical protein [Maribacter sp. 4G9]PIB39332.1 hypothetical protein BFP75_12175 [Maribacter sp. 4G9]
MIIKLLGHFKYSMVLLCVVFGNVHQIMAQENYRPGYVIIKAGDTLYGKISDRRTGPFGGIHDKIKFRGKGRKKRFPPNKILSYRKGDSVYRSFLLDGKATFLRVVSEGPVSLYKYELQEQGEEMVLDIAYLKRERNQELVRADQGIFGLKRQRLMQFFQDCPPLVEKIRSKEFKYPYQLVDYYNEWINK